METNDKSNVDKLIERQRGHFNKIAGKYFEARKSSNHLLFKQLIWKNFFNKTEKFKDVVDVLEPMCGYAEGRDILFLSNIKEIIYEGFDYSEELLRSVLKEDPSLNIYHCDVTKYEPKKQFDVVIIIGGLHHVPRYLDCVLNKVYQALKPAGSFLSFEPTNNNNITKAIRDWIYRNNNLFDDETEEAFELEDLNERASKAGFERVSQAYPGLLGYVLYYNPDAFPWLNVGGGGLVKAIYGIEKFMYTSWIGRHFSFATMTHWKRYG